MIIAIHQHGWYFYDQGQWTIFFQLYCNCLFFYQRRSTGDFSLLKNEIESDKIYFDILRE